MRLFNKIPLVMLLTALWTTVLAQGTSNVTVFGQVTDANGNGVAGVEILLNTDTDPTWAFFLTTTTDAEGDYEVNFVVDFPQGYFNVAMLDCDNEWVSTTHVFFNNVVIEQDFNWCAGNNSSCSTVITAEPINGAIQLVANAQGNPPFTYAWSNGATTQTTFPSFLGQTCVTVTDADGCVSSDCYQSGNNNCTVTISVFPSGGLIANANANAATYLWSTGETGQQIFPVAPGLYCVTATFADGCTATACQLYNGSGGGLDSCNNIYIQVNQVPGLPGVEACVVTPGADYLVSWNNGAISNCLPIYQSGIYCATVISPNGDVCELCSTITVNTGNNCSVQIGEDPANSGYITAYPSGTAPFTYAWSNGATTPGIGINSASGIYCVTVTDATGCTATDCYEVNNQNCTVNISVFPTGGLIAFANANIAQYVWSTGETGQQIFPVTPGLYCVTATLSDGCTASDCIYYNGSGGVDSCNNLILEINPVAGTIGQELCVIAPANTYSYFWSTGETGSCIFVAQSGTYCVTATSFLGEVCVLCATVVINGNNCGVQIAPSPNGTNWLTAYPVGQGPFSYQWSTGQNSATIQIDPAISEYCVTVTDASGCSATACYQVNNVPCAVVVTALNNDPNGYTLYALSPSNLLIDSWLWSTGETTSTIFVSQEGEYCVTATFTNGCTATDCYYLGGGNCQTTISIVPGAVGLFAITDNAAAPLTYLWNTGETTQSITPLTDGQYCCTVTDANGCVSSDCFYWDAPGGNDSCGVFITAVPLNNTSIELTATAYGQPPFTYGWSNGTAGNTVIVELSASNLICVSVTDATGCTAIACITLGGNFFNTISGSVYPLTNTAQQTGLVYLIQVTQLPNDILLTAVDTVAFSQDPVGLASYSFSNVAEGCYLIKAALDPGSPGYDGLLPTYYGDALFWNEASYVCVPNQLAIQYDIHLIPGNNPGGPGFIGGLVSEGAGLHEEIDEERGPGDPIQGALVVVTDLSDQPVVYAITGPDGTYGFGNLAWGTYKVWVEILGIEPIFTYVTIGPDHPSAEDINFEVVGSELTGATLPDPLDEMILYPNPVAETLFVKLPAQTDGPYQMAIYDMTGKCLFAQMQGTGPGDTLITIPVAALPSGVYQLQVTGEQKAASRKFVKP